MNCWHLAQVTVEKANFHHHGSGAISICGPLMPRRGQRSKEAIGAREAASEQRRRVERLRQEQLERADRRTDPDGIVEEGLPNIKRCKVEDAGSPLL